MKRRLKQRFRILLKSAVLLYHAVIHLRIAKEAVSLQSLALNDTCRHNTLTNCFGGLRPARCVKIRIVDTRDTNMKVNPIQQRSRQLARIALDLPRRTLARMVLISVVATRATMQITAWV